MSRMGACSAVGCVLASQRQVQPVLVVCGLEPGRLCSGILRTCVRSRGASALRRGAQAATIRCDLGFRTESSNRTTGQVDQVPHTEAFADFAQLRAAGCKETAQQPIPAELFQPLLPALGAPSQPLEDPRELRRDRGLPLTKEPAGIVDQLNLSPRNHRRPPRKSPRVPRAGSQSTPCDCCFLRCARGSFIGGESMPLRVSAVINQTAVIKQGFVCSWRGAGEF
jgi:hypothetical protein